MYLQSKVSAQRHSGIGSSKAFEDPQHNIVLTPIAVEAQVETPITSPQPQ